MIRSTFERRLNTELTGSNTTSALSQTQVNKNKLAKAIHKKLYILNDKLKDKIAKDLKDNKLSLPKLRELDIQVNITIKNRRLYILNDKTLKDKIAKNIEDNLLTLQELKYLNTQLDFIENNPTDIVSYYSNLYSMFNIRNPFSQHNIPMY
jgi:hypothetical protein